MSDSPAAIRARIDELRGLLARADGEIETHEGEIETLMGELREVLDCKPGKEKAAIKRLRDRVAKDTVTIEALLEEAEGLLEEED